MGLGLRVRCCHHLKGDLACQCVEIATPAVWDSVIPEGHRGFYTLHFSTLLQITDITENTTGKYTYDNKASTYIELLQNTLSDQ